MLRSVLLCLAFGLAPLPGHAASHQAMSVDEARLAYIAGQYATALEVLLPAAEAGDPVAQNIMGAAHEDGNGVRQDIDLALDWYERAADQGHNKALHNLGLLYATGAPGLTPDMGRAVDFYDRAIATGYGPSMNNRGQMHEKGQGGPVDLAAALVLYEMAADAGDVNAMNNAGQIYVDVQGAHADLERALELFRRAAALGDATGLSNLGAMYGNGFAVDVDEVAELALYRMAALRGNPQAAVNLAYALSEGPEGLRDPVEGYAWCLRGRDTAGELDAAIFARDCAWLAESLSTEDRAAAEALSLP